MRQNHSPSAELHVWPLALPILAGALIAVFAILLIRQLRLRWTWALLGIPMALMAWPLDWHTALALVVATISVTWGSFNSQVEIKRRGGEEAREMREAPGPIRFLISLSTPLHRPRQQPGKFALGKTSRGDACWIPMGQDTGVHSMVLGATGAGKTVTQAAIAQAYIRAGKAAVIVDPKGDPDLLKTVRGTANEMGVPFRFWSPGGPSVYNPLARGNPTEIADKALAAHEWSEPHYELATQRFLGIVISTMEAAGEWPPTLASLVDRMDLRRLHSLAHEVGGQTAQRVGSYITGLSDRGRDDLGGGRDRLAILAESSHGHWLEPHGDEEDVIDLASALQQPEVIYFLVDSDRYPAASKLLSAALIVDLVNLSSSPQAVGGLLMLDEFAAIAAPQVSRLLARARHAGLSLMLGAQSLADLRSAEIGSGPATLVEQVISNVEFVVAHRVADPDSAELLARVAGTRPGWAMTQRVGGPGLLVARTEGTRTRDREFVIGPDEFKRLAVGQAIVIDPKATPAAQVVDIWADRGGAQ
jgi:conjugal transfer pilus assembly protein TraD